MAHRIRPINPGEVQAGELEETGMSANALAKALGVPANRISAILNARRGITADTALRLARFFGTTPEFWLNLQQSHDLKLALRASKGRIAKTVRPRAGEPVAPS